MPYDEINHQNLKQLFSDLEKYPDMLEATLRDMYLQKVELSDMNFNDVCETLYSITGENEIYKNDIKRVIKKYQLKERKKGRDVLVGTTHNKIISRETPIHSWFTTLPVYIVTRSFGMAVGIYMMALGFKYTICKKSGVKIWYNKYNKNKGVPLVFFHASVGGVSLQCTIMKYYNDNHNIILPEIPGVSFLDVKDKPPSPCQIIDDVHNFITNIYVCDGSNVDLATLKINLMGHSLGTILCSTYINRYPKYICNFFCVEGHIFPTRVLRIYSDFYVDVGKIPKEDLITVPFFHRDLYVQYFIRRLNPDTVFLFDMNGDKKHIKIHMYHIRSDRRLLINPQLEYAKRKNIKVSFHLFDGDYYHGSFVFNNNIKKYVIEDIQKIYAEDEHNNISINNQKENSVLELKSENSDLNSNLNSDLNSNKKVVLESPPNNATISH
jgi:pimeloyl-ACP methyl ester carboxylesterase